ncbi:MAG: hypothetical protein JWO91_1116 [Acidobacteriaceae bacterium]|nr:hypothetical protein [Acidobacteriaceae bacterium]
MNMPVTILIPFCSIAVWIAQPLYAQTVTYSLSDLGSLSEGSSIVRSVNFNAQGAGVSGVPQDENQAVLWTNGRIQSLGFLPGGDYSAAFSVNHAGQVVGQANTATSVHAFLWNGNMKDLGTLPGDSSSVAYAINDPGQVAGYSGGTGGHHAVLWIQTAGIRNLGTLPGGGFSEAYGINNAGQVVGISDSPSGRRAFLWSAASGMQNLGALAGDSESRALKISNSGQVVGSSSNAASTHAFLWANGTMQFLGTLPSGNFSEALDVSNSGQVVGVATTNLGPRAFVWSSTTGMQDLNTLIPPNQVVLIRGMGVNDRGQIVAIGLVGADLAHVADPDEPPHAGPTHAFLLTPTH